MKEKTEKIAYDKLTPERKQLVDMVLANLENEQGLWKRGWRMPSAPESAITKKPYRGVNNLFLTLTAMKRNYTDNRWMTFHQMDEQDLQFKTDEEGNSLGKGAGVAIEFFELRDKKTKQRYNRSALDGMTADERDEYEQDNVYPVRKYYRVFNGDIIDGIAKKDISPLDESGKNARADKLLEFWSETETQIFYGGYEAYYSPSSDEIHLPERTDFESLQEFYSTALHEIGHSTGHEKRLNREIRNKFGDENYAIEELRAELASLFMEQELEISVDEKHIRNNSAYIKDWHNEIKENPNTLFLAIADADKIAKYVAAKELKVTQKETEPYAIEIGADVYGDNTYKLYLCASYGLLTAPMSYEFSSREALMTEFKKMQKLPLWADKEFREIGMSELNEISFERAKTKDEQKEKSEVFIKPSEVAKKSIEKYKAAEMNGKGVESLTRMNDREVVERAEKTKNGAKFSALYKGLSILGNEGKDERSLMTRLAMFCFGDKDKLLRIFQSSGQFREEKPSGFYEKMAEQSLQFIATVKENVTKLSGNFGSDKAKLGANAKS